MGKSKEDTIISSTGLLGDLKLSYGQSDESSLEHVGDPNKASPPLTQVAAGLKESFYKSNWAVAGSGTSGPVSAGPAPEVYTTALRAALVEYGDSPTATLPDRLRAADGLAAFLGMSSGAHEALMLRALAANEKLVLELQAQAHALRHHRCGLTSADFESKQAYATWRARALRSVRAALLAQQRLPEYNALLEVAILEARDLARPSKKGIFRRGKNDKPIRPYAWARLDVPYGAAGGGGTVQDSVTQNTQVLMDSGPNPAWQAMLQPLTITHKRSELNLKVSHCKDEQGFAGPQDQDVGVSGILIEGLLPAVTQQMVLPLYEPPPADPNLSTSGRAGTDFYRVVYDPANDEIWGAKIREGPDLKQQGRIVLQLRYVAEKRTRYDVPNEAVFFGNLSEDDSDIESTAGTSRASSSSGFAGSKDPRFNRSQALQKGSDVLQRGSEALQRGIGKGVDAVVTGAQVTVDYLQHLTHALAHGFTDNALTNMVGINGSSKVRHVSIQLVTKPPDMPRNPSITNLNTAVLIKQLAMALASAARSGCADEHASAALAELPMMPTIPEDIRDLMMGIPQRRSSQSSQPKAMLHQQTLSRRSGQPGRSAYSEAQPPPAPTEEAETSNALQETWSLLEDAMVKPYLPFGPAIGVFLRAGLLLCVRVETLLILIVQHMLDDWPKYIGSTVKGRGGSTKGDNGAVGGAQDYLHALRMLWGKCLTWHTAATLVNDETKGVTGVQGLLLSRALPALEKHYTVFAGKEGASCFIILLEMVGWAWTWDPTSPIPYDLLSDYLKEGATRPMKQDFRINAATLTKDIDSLVHEVGIANEYLKRDKAIQSLMPGMKRFAAASAAARYELLFNHLEAIPVYLGAKRALQEPKEYLEAMQKMFELEAVLLEHHRLLVQEGYASALPPCPVPEDLLPRKGVEVEEFTIDGFELEDTGEGVRRCPLIRQRARYEAVTNLWDWETYFIDEICRWVRVGVADLDERVKRLLEAETWTPASKHTTIANSQLELSRLVEVHLTTWLYIACGGSEARRLRVGLLITACLGHVHHHYITGATAVWEQELVARQATLTGIKVAPGAPVDSKQAGKGAGVPPVDSFESLELGPGGALPSVSVSASYCPKYGHKRGQSQSTAFANGLVLSSKYGNVAALRTLLESGMKDHTGLFLTRKMAVIRSTLHRVTQEVHDVGVYLLQCLVVPFVTAMELPRTGSELLTAVAARNRANGALGSDSDEDSLASPDTPGVRPTLTSMRAQPSVKPTADAVVDNPWARKKAPAPTNQNVARNASDEQDTGANPWARKKPASAASGAGSRASPLARPAQASASAAPPEWRDPGEAAADADTVLPISNFVGAYWQELQRRTAAVITSLVSSYSVTSRSLIVSMMVASCGTKRDERIEEKFLKDLLRAVDEELTAMSQGMDGEAVLVAEMTGALWRAVTSALQLLALNQAGFRPLTAQECEELREFLLTLSKDIYPGVPKLVREKQPPLNWEKVSDPRYPQELAQMIADMATNPIRQFSIINGMQPRPLPAALRASLAVFAPEVPEDDVARRCWSRHYCAALLHTAGEAKARDLQDSYMAQAASINLAQPSDFDNAVYLPRSPQQVPLLDLLRLMRARRSFEKATAVWADDKLGKASAIVTEVLFGLVRSQNVVAEFKCALVGASKSAGRLIITQGALCFTTMLDADAKAACDTTLSILRAKVVSVCPMCEAGTLVLTTSDHDILAFTTFASTAERDRLMTLLTAPTRVRKGIQARAPVTNAAAKPKDPAGPVPASMQLSAAATVQQPAIEARSAVSEFAPTTWGSSTSSSASNATSFYGSGNAGGSGNRISPKRGSKERNETRKDPKRGSKETRAAAKEQQEAEEHKASIRAAHAVAAAAHREEEARRAAEEAARVAQAAAAAREAGAAAAAAQAAAKAAAALAETKANPPPAPVTPPVARSSVDARHSPAPAPTDPELVISAPCAWYGSIYDTPGVLSVYEDRVEFAGATGALLQSIPLPRVASVTQTKSYFGAMRLTIKVEQDNPAAAPLPLEFTGLSDALITSIKEQIIKLM